MMVKPGWWHTSSKTIRLIGTKWMGCRRGGHVDAHQQPVRGIIMNESRDGSSAGGRTIGTAVIGLAAATAVTAETAAAKEASSALAAVFKKIPVKVSVPNGTDISITYF